MIPGQQEQFKFPRELERRPSRPVRRKAGTLGCGIIAVRFLALALLGAGLILLGRIPVVIMVVTQGQSVPGQIEKTWTSRGKRSTNYHLQYSYEAGGQIHTDSRSISKSWYGQLSPGSPVLLDVRVKKIGGTYFEQAYLPGESLWTPVWLAVFFAVLVNGIAGVLVYLMLIVPMQHKRLCREAKPIVGHITKMHSSSGKQIHYYLDYEWGHPGFGLRTATMTVQSEPWHRAQVGEPVSVLCLPHRKRPTVIYEYGDFECF
jgi:hypothetical protein